MRWPRCSYASTSVSRRGGRGEPLLDAVHEFGMPQLERRVARPPLAARRLSKGVNRGQKSSSTSARQLARSVVDPEEDLTAAITKCGVQGTASSRRSDIDRRRRTARGPPREAQVSTVARSLRSRGLPGTPLHHEHIKGGADGRRDPGGDASDAHAQTREPCSRPSGRRACDPTGTRRHDRRGDEELIDLVELELRV